MHLLANDLLRARQDSPLGVAPRRRNLSQHWAQGVSSHTCTRFRPAHMHALAWHPLQTCTSMPRARHHVHTCAVCVHTEKAHTHVHACGSVRFLRRCTTWGCPLFIFPPTKSKSRGTSRSRSLQVLPLPAPRSTLDVGTRPHHWEGNRVVCKELAIIEADVSGRNSALPRARPKGRVVSGPSC